MLISIFFLIHTILTWWYHNPAKTAKAARLYLATYLLQLLSREEKSHRPLLENSFPVGKLHEKEEDRNGDGHS